MFSTGRLINVKEVSLDSEKTNCFLSDPSGMTARSSAMNVLRKEQLQQRGGLQDVPWHRRVARTPIAQLRQMAFSPAKPLAPR